MSVRLGTVAPVGFHEFPPEQWLRCMRELGCSVVQVYRNQLISVPRQQMLDAIAAGGLPCDSLHAIFGEQFDPSAPLERARRFAVETYKSEGELAAALGGPLVVVHCSTIRRQGVSPEERKERLVQLRKSVEDLAVFGQSLGIRYAFENLPAYHPVGSDVAELAKLLAEAAQANVGMCFDCGHANMAGDVVQAVSDAAGRIIYVHLNDNSGKGDDHLMPTYGGVDMLGLARALHSAGYDGTLMLEVFYGLEALRRFVAEGCAPRLKKIVDAANGVE
jgi:sugar phosphate isomerase/epimerase